MKNYQRENKKTFIYRTIAITEHFEKINAPKYLFDKLNLIEESTVDFEDLEFPISYQNLNKIVESTDETKIDEILREVQESLMSKNLSYVQTYCVSSTHHTSILLNHLRPFIKYLDVCQKNDNTIKVDSLEILDNSLNEINKLISEFNNIKIELKKTSL